MSRCCRACADRRARIKGRCRACRFFAACGGSLRVRADVTAGDPWAPDPACYLTDEEIETQSAICDVVIHDAASDNRQSAQRATDLGISPGDGGGGRAGPANARTLLLGTPSMGR